MIPSPGGSICPMPPGVVRELLLRITRGHPGEGVTLTPQLVRAYLRPLVKRVVLTGDGPRGLTRWVSRQRGANGVQSDHLSVVAELTTRLAEVLLPPADPHTQTVIARSW